MIHQMEILASYTVLIKIDKCIDNGIYLGNLKDLSQDPDRILLQPGRGWPERQSVSVLFFIFRPENLALRWNASLALFSVNCKVK